MEGGKYEEFIQWCNTRWGYTECVDDVKKLLIQQWNNFHEEKISLKCLKNYLKTKEVELEIVQK